MADNLKDILLDKDPKNNKPQNTSLKDILKSTSGTSQATDIQLGQFSVGESKYDIGITPENVPMLGEVRGQRQPSIAKLGAGLANAVTQTGIDIIKDASYLLDYENYTDFTKSSQEGFNNWLAQSLQSVEDKIKLPVYRTKESEGFSPTSAGWWADNIPSIVSTVSMMIPAEAAVMGLSKVGKLLGGEKLIKGIEKISGATGLSDNLKGVTGAVISRQMENIMEGSQTFEDTYNEVKKKNPEISDEEAKRIAGEAAANNYKLNWANLATDLPQYMLLHKTFKQTLKDQKFSTAELAKTMFQESAEEGYQFVSNEESKRAALINNNVLTDDKSSLTDRLKDYAKDGEFWTSVFLGGLGGGIFSGIAAYKNNRNLPKLQEQYDTLAKLHAATVKGDEPTFNRVSDEAFSNELVSSLKEDAVDNFKEVLNKTVEIPDDPQERLETNKRLSERNEVIEFAKDLKDKLTNETSKSPELRALELNTSIDQHLTTKRLNEINTKISKVQAQDQVALQLTDPTLYQFKIAKLTYDAIKDISSLGDKATGYAKSIAASYDLFAKEGLSKEDIDKQLVSIHDKELTNLYKNKELDTKNLNGNKDILYSLSTPEGISDLQKEVDTIKKEVAKQKEEQAKQAKAEEIKAAESPSETLKDVEDKKATINNVPAEEVTPEMASEYEAELEALNTKSTKIKEELTKKEFVEVNSKDGVVPDLSNKEKKQLEENLQETISTITEDGKEVSPQGSVVYVGDKIVEAATALAYLSKNYEEVYSGNEVSKKDVSEKLNESMQEPLLLSPSHYQVGDELVLEVDTAFNIVKDDKTTLTYDMYKNDPDMVPIKVSNKEGKIIAYLHVPEWINEKNVADVGDNIATQKEALKKLRREIIANPKTVKITSKTFGKLSFTTNREDRRTVELIKAPVQFAVGKDNAFWTGLESPLSGNQPVNKKITSGLVYMIVPTPVKDKTVALPVFNTKVTSRIAETLANATEIFFTQNKEAADKVYDKLGIDLLTNRGLRNFFNLFVSTNSFDQTDLNNAVGRDDKFFLDVIGNGIKYGTGGNNMRDIGDPRFWNKAEFVVDIQIAYISVFLSHMDKDTFKYAFINDAKEVEFKESTYPEFIKEYTTTNIVEQDLGNGEYSYFVQPVINFGESTKADEVIPTIDTPTDTKPVTGFPTSLGSINLDNINLDEDYLPANLNTRQVDNIAKESSLINGFTAARQAQVLGVMNAYVLKELKSGKSKEAKEIYNSLKTEFEKYRDAYAAVDSEKAKYVSNEFSKILENYDSFVQQSATRLTFFNVKETSTGDLFGFEDFGSNNEKTNFDDGATFQIDSKEGMSSRLKQFLSFIPSTKKNYLGLESYMSYDEVVNYLSGQLAGLDASYVDIATKLSELSVTNPWIKTVKELLDNSPEQVKNEFIQWATKHYTGFKIVNLVKGPDDFTIKVMDSDQNSVAKLIQNKWLANLKTSSLVKETTPGNLIIDNSARKVLVNEAASLDKNNVEAIKNWLAKLGIDISDATLENIKENTRFPIEKQFTDANGIFKTIIENLSKETLDGDDSFESNNPLLNNSGIRKLATLEAKYSPAYFSNSFKNGEGKTIYSYSANKYFINQFFKLKQNKDGYLNDILKINFNSTSSWGKQLLNSNSYFSQVFDYFYVDTLKVKNDGTTLANMSSREHEVTKLGLFQNQNNGSDRKGRIAHFLFPTMSDKSTMTGLTALKQDVNLRFTGTDYSIGKESIDAVFAIVEGEYNRIRASYNIDNTVDGYNPNKFYFFEELNDNESLWLEDGNKKTLNPLTPEREALIKDIIEKHLRNLISAKLSHWGDLGLIVKGKLAYVDKTYLTAVKSKLSAEAKANDTLVNTYMAADYVINYVIANANAFQLFIGDPAQFAKKTLDATWINIGKRLAGEIAPGLELADSKDNKYTQAFVNDSTGALRISKNYAQIEKLLGKEQAEAYRDIDSTDAQEYTTLAEHLYVLEKSGKLSSEEVKGLLEKEENGKLSKKDLKTIFQPIKPVYVNTQLEPSIDLNRKIYIKSSSFPLVKGLSPELDKLRAQMLAQGVDRVAFKTATKVGGPKSFITIFNDNGTIKEDIDFSNKMLLDREGFRLQQEVPFDETKEAINRGTQESKLLFANLLEVNGFDYNGKKLSGKQLQDEYNDLNRQLFENAKAELFRELDYNGTTLDIVKVQTMLMDEAAGRGWSQNDIDSLKLINVDKFTQTFAMPLWSSTSANRIEALLNSLVDNRIRKQKFRGKSFVLASEEGFIGKSNNIVYTKNYDPSTGLLPQRIVDGKVLPAQILIANNLRDINGKLINLSQFIGEDGLLDLTKIDEDLLKVFGFRIPTQGLNSMTYAEIVGFLPNYMADLVIAPKDYTKQMGSDFDVDKLYLYMYNTKKSGESLAKFTYSDIEIEDLYNDVKNKKLGYKDKIITEVFENPYWIDTFKGDLESFKYEFKQREVQNKILDIHFSVFTNPNEEVQKQILHPLGFGNLPELAAKVDKYRNKRNAKTFKPTRLSDTYQKDKYMKARGGKSGCLGYGTKVLMFDGSFKEVQNIKVGDQLMGIDSTPRNVLELKRGVEQMYWIRQNKGIDYRVNENHVLSIKYKTYNEYSTKTINGKKIKQKDKIRKEGTEETINIKLNSFLLKNIKFKNSSYGYKSNGIDFKEKSYELDPYYLGLWLGDGSTREAYVIHNEDKEVINYLDFSYGVKYTYGLKNISKVLHTNIIKDQFKKTYNINKMGLNSGGKYIPDNYLYTSKSVRLALLAGLIDSDGWYCKINKQYKIATNSSVLKEQIAFLTRSLGFYTSISLVKGNTKKYPNGKIYTCTDYYNITFVPECNIPVLIDRKKQVKKSDFKNRLHTGFTIEKDIIDNYYGFVLDGDHLFMLEDLTITHNTGVKSLDSVFTAISQGKNIIVATIDEGGKEKAFPLIFGDESGKAIELHKISSKKSINGNPKLNTVAAYQSAAVDNEKEQILEKINSNNYTFDAERALAAVGYTEEFIVPLTGQDIIFEYADEMSRMQDSLNDKYISRPEQVVMDKLIEKYAREAGFSDTVLQSLLDSDYPLTQKQMWDAIELGPTYADYYKVQIWALSKFNRVREVGKEISNIQLSINTDSSGVAPSLIESNFKEEKVDNIGSNKFILNANNLLDNTINGYATENALRVANELWSKYFPYGTSNVKNTFTEIQMLTGKEVLTNDARQAIFNQMKSFVYSKDLGIGNVSDRENLFFDTPTNKSLATRVKELQKTSGNPFIQRLIPEPDITGTKPSLIKYNAGVAENLDELSVYQGFADLFVNPATRTLAQELVEYFYLSGGIQQAIQFGKYIPNAYLTNIGFADALRKINFNDEAILGINNFKEHYYDTSNFAKQWIQHNPGQAIKLDPELSQIKKSTYNSSKELISFESDAALGKDLLVQRRNPQTGEPVMVLPEFVSLLDKKASKKFRLFQYVGNGKYVQIDTLGTFGYSEYNQSFTNAKSLIKNNQATPVEVTRTVIDAIESKDTEVLNNKLPIDRVVEYGLNKGVKSAMETISKSPNKLHAALAKEILKKDLKIKVSIVDNPSVRGSFNYPTNTLAINPMNIKSDSEFERVLLHETIHYLTGHTIRSTSRTPEQERIVKSLTALQTAFKQKIDSNPQWKAEFDAFVKAYEAKEGLDETQISKNYGALKLTEFVTMAMTDTEFQKILNDIPFSGQKTLLDRFIDLIKELLESLGFPVKEDSVLTHSIENIVELINLSNPDFVESEKSSNLVDMLYKWARRSNNSYEVSSKGDKRFSALYAKLKDSRTIEEAYQLDIKGYRSQGDNWMLGKGKPPIRKITKEQQWEEYKNLWRQYLNENPNLFNELKEKAYGKILTDMFASTDISQARALAEILNEEDQLPTTNQLPELKPCY